jgi:hypothetical protein
MARTRTYLPYRPKKNEYIIRFSVNKYRTIQYYCGKVSGEIIGRLAGMKTSAFSLWRSNDNSKIPTPEGWHPSLAFDRRVEDAAVFAQKIYLGCQSLSAAAKDIARSQLSHREKGLVMRFLNGEYSSSVAKEFRLSNPGARYIYRQALLSVYHELGARRWIHLASKGHIRRWNQTNYR